MHCGYCTSKSQYKKKKNTSSYFSLHATFSTFALRQLGLAQANPNIAKIKKKRELTVHEYARFSPFTKNLHPSNLSWSLLCRADWRLCTAAKWLAHNCVRAVSVTRQHREDVLSLITSLLLHCSPRASRSVVLRLLLLLPYFHITSFYCPRLKCHLLLAFDAPAGGVRPWHSVDPCVCPVLQF